MYVHVECMVCPVKGQYVVEVKHSLLKRCSQIFMATIFLHYIEEYFACDMFSKDFPLAFSGVCSFIPNPTVLENCVSKFLFHLFNSAVSP